MTREEADKIRKIPFVFILGKGRSGTTLLQSLFNSHPNVVAPPESRFIVMHARRFGRMNKWTEAEVNLFVELLYTEFLFADFWKPDRQELTDFLLSALEYLNYPLACKMVYYYMKGTKENIILLSDKNPFYAIFIHTLVRVFPEAKFIHLIRDPRDNVASTLRTFKIKNSIYMSLQWLMFNRIIEKNKSKTPANYFTLRYEDMVKDVEGTMKQLCGFLRLPYNEAMKDIDRKGIKDKYLVKGMDMEENKKAMLEPISEVNIDKWKKELKPKDIAIVENIAGNYALQKYGYPHAKVTVSAPVIRIAVWKIIYRVWLAFTRFRYTRYSVHAAYSKFKRKTSSNIKPEWGDVLN